MANKLELTWCGKEEEIRIEPRLLVEKPELSNCKNDVETDNMLIHGDNLLALKALEKKYAGKIKCIYIDPPYNTGEAFDEYNDNIEHSIWLNLMRARLVQLKKLLAPDGVIFVQLNDDEMNYCKVMMDEIFSRNNFINIISLFTKVSAGASGGGEDKKLKKNIEYILVYANDFNNFVPFKPVYKKTPLMRYIQQMKDDGKSYKYTNVLVKCDDIKPYKTIKDGSGENIELFSVGDYEITTVKKLAQKEKLTEEEIFEKYYDRIMTTTNAQTSIRTRVWDATDSEDNMYIASYIPKSGKNKGKKTDLIFKGKQKVLVIWLKDTAEKEKNKIYKKERIGTFWDGFSWINVNKEGKVSFSGGKKPEQLIQRILEMATEKGDIVLDSFLGSGTTAAVAHKMGRKYIGIEMGEHCYTKCKPRLDYVCKNDPTGISEDVNWKGGGAFKFYELAPSLIDKDDFDEYIINSDYNADMLAAAVALNEGFDYDPDPDIFWKQAKGNEDSYLYTTTRHITADYLDSIKNMMSDNEFLIIACKSFDAKLNAIYKNITLKKIPQLLLEKCEFGKDNYNLNIVHPPIIEEYDEEEIDE